MNGGWQQRDFEDCIESVKYSEKVQRKDFKGEGRFPVISQEFDFINGYWDNPADVFRVKTPLVVFGDHTKVLKYVDFDFVLGADGVKLLQPRDFLLPKFFFYQLQSIDLDTLGYARHYRLLKESRLSYPSLSEQQRIVGILDEAFAAIATAKANTEQNLTNARALFVSQLHAAFSQRGEGWLERSVGDVCEFENGDRGENYPSKDVQTTSGIPFINAGHLGSDGIDLAEMNFIPRSRFDLLGAGKVRRGDVLFCLRGSLGKVAIVNNLDEGAIASSLVILRPGRAVSGDYLLAYLKSDLCAREIERYRNGAAQPNLSARSLSQFRIPIPPQEEQQRIVDMLGTLWEETQRLDSLAQQKLAALDALKKSLLHQAFTGQLTGGGAERSIAGAT